MMKTVAKNPMRMNERILKSLRLFVAFERADTICL